MLSHEKKEEARAVIDEIARRNGGTITPEEVVEHAKNEDSPLHEYFEWNDSEAARKYRIVQARTLIRGVKVVLSTDTKKVATVAYVRDPSKGSGEAGYISVSRVKSDKEQARDVMIAEFKRAGGALRRARSLAAYFDMEDRLDGFIAELNLMHEQIRGRDDATQ